MFFSSGELVKVIKHNLNARLKQEIGTHTEAVVVVGTNQAKTLVRYRFASI